MVLLAVEYSSLPLAFGKVVQKPVILDIFHEDDISPFFVSSLNILRHEE
jgi:hypothetical protein